MLEILSDIYGIGPVLAQDLQKRLPVTPKPTILVVRRLLKDPLILATLPVATQADLEYSPIRDIPRDIIHVMDGELHKYFRGHKFAIAGSYLRGKPISHDIDLVVQHTGRSDPMQKMQQYINNESKILHIQTPYAQGTERATTIFQIKVPEDLQYLFKEYPKWQLHSFTDSFAVNIKVDIFITNNQEYVFALLFATGSGAFNVHMRALAKRKGYLLNQRGLYKKMHDGTLEQLHLHTEKQIFEALGMTYRTPAERQK